MIKPNEIQLNDKLRLCIPAVVIGLHRDSIEIALLKKGIETEKFKLNESDYEYIDKITNNQLTFEFKNE